MIDFMLQSQFCGFCRIFLYPFPKFINMLIVKFPQRILNILKLRLFMITQDYIFIIRTNCAIQVLNFRIQKTLGIYQCPQLFICFSNLKNDHFESHCKNNSKVMSKRWIVYNRCGSRKSPRQESLVFLSDPWGGSGK